LDNILDRVAKESRFDFEAAEFFIRTSVLAWGAKILEKVLAGVGADRLQGTVRCTCGQTLRSRGLRTRRVRTILGSVTVRRPLYHCSDCGARNVPADTALGLAGTGFSPGTRRMMTRAGSRESFQEAAEDLRLYAQLELDARDIERVAEQVGQAIDAWMKRESSTAILHASSGKVPPSVTGPIPLLYISLDGTGTPLRRSELTATRSKPPGDPAKTREAKLGCIFTQTTLDDHGRPMRDPASTTYVGAIETSVEFGYRLHGEAVRRGLYQARVVAVLCDGAAYNKSIAAEHFPQAILIIDLYHAREHLFALIKLLLSDAQHAVREKWLDLLNQGDISPLFSRTSGPICPTAVTGAN